MSASRLAARFVLDAKGVPVAVTGNRLHHYEIQLRVDDPPPDAYAVTYELHDSYYDPIRESRGKSRGFAEDITSYGDFVVQARVRAKARTIATAALLSEALRRGHAGAMSESIERAILEIEQR